MRTLVSANIVIVARNLNPSIFSSLWLVEEEIAKKEDFVEDPICTPMATCAVTSGFRLDVFPERLQIAFTNESLDNPKLAIKPLGDIVHKLQHTPYVAIGANIRWNICPDNPDEFIGLMRKLFAKSDLPLYAEFAGEDARFGGYLSKNFLGVRMKVDVKPMKEESEFLRFSFNYHLDLEHGKHMDQMEDFLDNWPRMRSKSEAIATSALSVVN